MPKSKRKSPPGPELQRSLLHLHDTISKLRPIAELVGCLSDHPDSIPPAVVGIVGSLLHEIDEELRARLEEIQTAGLE